MEALRGIRRDLIRGGLRPGSRARQTHSLTTEAIVAYRSTPIRSTFGVSKQHKKNISIGANKARHVRKLTRVHNSAIPQSFHIESFLFGESREDDGPTSLCHEPHSTNVVFGRRRRRTSLTETVSKIGATTFELVKPVVNSDKDGSSP
ncbi:hypothetical protein EVAR_13439_1 [Eumeta japonica]|uniref:Uncharacterized protein n=1 Tax=Eumeta variegata TaxID=151549 RepID=A0A4C1V6Z8_EUMVA|nr:hypothetical protein EVAR_13439_1 [Eumeta japonica]